MLKKRMRVLSFVVLLCLLFTVCAAKASDVHDPTIRVYLRRLKIADSVHIVTKGTYMLEDGSMLFSDNTEMSISLRENQLVLHTGGAAIRLGSQVKLLRCNTGEAAGLALNGSGLYEGDLLLRIEAGAIMPVLYIHVEDYLLGVVPFEMGDSFPLEALKAQAVAARTYALRKQGADVHYDVEDTTNDQAYRGRTTYSPISEQAVKETEGLVGIYKGRLAQCYYSASNGGQTELGQHVWPTSEPDAYGYMTMQDDPYDYENAASLVKRYTISKNSKKNGLGEALHQALVSALHADLEALGKEAAPDCVRIDEVHNVTLMTPKFDGESRLMTQMQFSINISVRDCLFKEEKADPIVAALTPASEDATPAPTNTPAPTATPAYTQYTPLDQVFLVTLPVFPTVEQAMGLSINTYQNELLSVYDIGSSFMIESRRYGHGVGMSQRGAEQMANHYAMTSDEILAFYYPGMTVEKLVFSPASQPTPDMVLLATPAPTASPTPRPTLMPVTKIDLPKGSYIAIVANIAEDSSLNLRESASMSSEILKRLYYNQELIVLSSSKDGWSHVKTDAIEGYVRTEFLQTAEE